MFKIGSKVIVYFDDGVLFCTILRLWPSWAEVEDVESGKHYATPLSSMTLYSRVTS